MTPTKHPTPKPRNTWVVLDSLKPGESITFPLDLYTQLNTCLQYRQRRDGKQFCQRKEAQVMRVWRLT